MKSGLSGVVRENSKQKNIITVASTADKVSSEFLYKYYAYYCATRHTIVVSRMFTFCASLSSGIVPPALRNKSPLRVIRGLSEPCKALGEMQTKMTVLLSSAVWIIQRAKTPPSESAILVAVVERSFLREERESAGTAKGEKEITRGWCARNKRDNAIGRCKAQRGPVGYGGGIEGLLLLVSYGEAFNFCLLVTAVTTTTTHFRSGLYIHYHHRRAAAALQKIPGSGSIRSFSFNSLSTVTQAVNRMPCNMRCM